jgi:drug/metabolite transporter (DMT)-like permease
MMSGMTGRVLTWAGGVVAVVSAVVLVVYFVMAGFHLLDTLGVIGAVVGIVGLVLAVYGIVLSRRTGGGEGQDPPSGPPGTQRARASGRGRVYQAGRDQTINDK